MYIGRHRVHLKPVGITRLPNVAHDATRHGAHAARAQAPPFWARRCTPAGTHAALTRDSAYIAVNTSHRSHYAALPFIIVGRTALKAGGLHSTSAHGRHMGGKPS